MELTANGLRLKRKACAHYLRFGRYKLISLWALSIAISMILATPRPGHANPMLILTTCLGISLSGFSTILILQLIKSKRGTLANQHRQTLVHHIKQRKNVFSTAFFSTVCSIFVLDINISLTINALIQVFFLTIVGIATIQQRIRPNNILKLPIVVLPLFSWWIVTTNLDSNLLLYMMMLLSWSLLCHHIDSSAQKNQQPIILWGFTNNQLNIILNTIVLTVVTLLPFAVDMTGMIYLICTIGLNSGFYYYSVLYCRQPNTKNKEQITQYKTIYLITLASIITVDHFLPILR